MYAVFHISLLKKWNAGYMQEDEEQPLQEPEVEEPFYQTENVIGWRKVKRGRRIVKRCLVLWKD